MKKDFKLVSAQKCFSIWCTDNWVLTVRHTVNNNDGQFHHINYNWTGRRTRAIGTNDWVPNVKNTADNNDDPLHHINYHWNGERVTARVSQTKSNVNEKVFKAQSKKLLFSCIWTFKSKSKMCIIIFMSLMSAVIGQQVYH